jgi:hypothetical protein
MAGGGVMYVRPYYANNSAFTTTPIGGVGAGTQITSTDFDREWEAAPYGWVAFIGKSGLGGRLRAWHLRQSEDAALVSSDPLGVVSFTGLNIPSAGLGDTLVATNTLRMSVIDLEAICQYNEGCWSFLAGFGGRWADVEQTRNGRLTSLVGGAAFAESQNDFRAIGPTVALEASRAFNRHLALYVNGRATALFGTHHLDQTSQSLAGAGFTSNSSDDWTPVLEVEAGVQGAFPIREHCYFVIRGGFTAQTWVDLGSSIGHHGNLDLVGGILQFGIAY